MLTNVEFCNFHYPLPWKQSKMATKQKELFEVCVKGIICLPNMTAEIDTDAYYVYFVRRILSYVAFCIFNKFIFNICRNSAVFFQLKHHKTKTNCITTKSFWQNLDNYPYKRHAKFHCSNFAQSWANLGWRWETDLKDFHQHCSKQRQPPVSKQSLLTIYT